MNLRNILLSCTFFFLSPAASANVIHFPLLNGQTAEENWDCQCEDQRECQVEKINDQSVITIPDHCSLTTLYTDLNNAAIQWEVLSKEKPVSPQILGIFSTEGLFKFHKLGMHTTLKNNIYHTITGYANLDKIHKVILGIFNTTSQPLHIIRSIVHTSKTERSGALLGALGGSLHGTYTIESPSDNSAWIPLPLDYENQVPLDVQFKIEPKKMIQSIKYEVDDVGNWGAAIQFAPNIPNGSQIDFVWEATVLTNDGLYTAKNHGYKTPEKFQEWLAASAIVQSNNPAIAKTAQSLFDPNATLQTIANIIVWMQKNIHFGVDESLDATHVFESHTGSCTGYSNLAAAMGRALGIPSMTIAGYMVGSSGETHWINQFYLGHELGWFRFEPQYLVEAAPEYFIPVHIDRIAEEIKWACTFGVSKNAYPIVPIQFDRPNGELEEAFELMEFADPQKKMNSVFNKARKAWQQDFKTLLAAGEIPESRLKIRGEMKNAHSLSEVEGLLDKLALA